MYRVFYRSRTRSIQSSHKSTTSGSLTPNISRTNSKTEFEITSIIIRQYLEKKKYDKAIKMIRELSSIHILKCLESFPFSTLNHTVPHSFPIWESLFVKLHNSEEGGYIAQVPHTACHQLVTRIATILAYLEKHHEPPQLYTQCKRVLKKVYMHYPDITQHLMRENEHLSRAIYTLTLHIPLGTDSLAVTLQQAIQDEVNASLIDLKDAIEHLEELPLQMGPNTLTRNGCHHSLTQRQIQERLYFNQCILHSVSPCRRKDYLSQLEEMLESRIQGDKDVLSLFACLRQQHEGLSDCEPVEPKLRHQHHSIECTIAVLQEIQNELAINSPPSSPVRESACISPDTSVNGYPLAAAVSLDHTQFTKVIPQERNISRYRSSSEKHLLMNPSAVHTVMEKDIYSSDQDIPSSSSCVHPSPLVMAGVKKKGGGLLRRSLRNSMKRLSSSAGNVSSTKSKHNSYNKTADDNDTLLETTSKELLEARELIASLKRRERELTDRLSEQAQRHLQGSEHFEDILMGANRPTLVVQRFQEIYSQERIEAYDSIADIDGTDLNMSIPTFLLDILKYCYSAAQCSLESLHTGWKRALNVREGIDADDRELHAVKQLESSVSVFIRKVSCSYDDIQSITTMVYWDLERSYGSLSFYQSMIDSIHVQSYVDECALLSWELVIQNPPMVLKYSEMEFTTELHSRFHTANRQSEAILYYQWPTLVHETSGLVLLKGIVVT